ncbi:unnamed protein product [Rotaria magnacalcarata]|uniref:Uncharacterized protein n=1 Tax=Rotaria magnacalcarata TaxID=392030 RepID=A0A816W093_9BILA|nr:unnamed protein product [Rotaria magnacalcarata]
MTKSADIRDIVIAHYKNGKKAPEISNMLANKVHRTTVHRWIQRFNQSGSVDAHVSPGRRRTGRTKRLINLVKKRINSQRARKTSRTMAADFNSNQRTIRRVLKEDLKMKCY